MEPGIWHAFPSVFDELVAAPPGEVWWRATSPVPSGEWLAKTFPARTGIQFVVNGAARSDIDALPSLEVIAPRMIRESLTALPDARYAFDLVVCAAKRTLRSTGLVSVEIQLTVSTSDAAAPARERSEVERAFERGLLDRRHRDNADFRLRMRPVSEQLRAIQASGYVPDWRVNVLFSAFCDEASGEWLSPVDLAEPEALAVMLEPRPRNRGFRMSDLFSRD